MTYKNFISSKTVIFMLAALLAFLGYLKIKQYRVHSAVEKEKTQLLRQETALRQKNEELSQSLSYLSSESFKEKIAREQLNLKREGEAVYTFGEKQTGLSEPLPEASAGKPNYQKWISYFTK